MALLGIPRQLMALLGIPRQLMALLAIPRWPTELPDMLPILPAMPTATVARKPSRDSKRCIRTPTSARTSTADGETFRPEAKSGEYILCRFRLRSGSNLL